MRKVKYFLVLMLLFLITGCSSYDMSMKIEKDKSMIYTVTILSNTYNSTLANNVSVYREKYEQYGYLVEEYNQNNMYGMIISKRFDNIDDISYGERSDEFNLLYLYTDGYSNETESKMFNVKKGFLYNRYAANFYVDLSNLGINLNNSTVTYSVELPDGTISNNANLVSEDKNKLTWNITSSGKTEIDYVFELSSYDNLYYGVAIIVVLFLLFLIISNFFSKSDNVKSEKRSRTVSDIDRTIENLTNNAIKNSTNNNKVVKVVPTNTVKNKTVNTDTIKMIQPTQINNTENKGDISAFKTPTTNKNKKLFGIFKINNNKKSEFNNINVNDNDEFNRLIDNINNKTIVDNNELISENDNIANASVNNTSMTNINANPDNGNNLDDIFGFNYDNKIVSVPKKEDEKTIDNNIQLDNNIIKIEPIYNSDNNTSVENISLEEDKTFVNFDTIENNEQKNNFQDSINNDVSENAPVIRVNSRNIVVNNDKKDN